MSELSNIAQAAGPSGPIGTPADFGLAFRRERRFRKLSQIEVAAKVGVTRQTIADIESGENVGIHTILKALAVLQRTLSIRPRSPLRGDLHLLLDPEDRDDGRSP